MEFKLHSQLKKDLVFLCRTDLCDVLLMPNSDNPWIVLVPRIAHIKEFHQLDEESQLHLLKDINKFSALFEKVFRPEKINIASFGNMVPQLHIHIIARYKNDKAWPGSIFGVELGKAESEIQKFQDLIKANLTSTF